MLKPVESSQLTSLDKPGLWSAGARECLILLGSHKPGLGSENLSENTEREMREREDEINQNIALTVPQSEGQ